VVVAAVAAVVGMEGKIARYIEVAVVERRKSSPSAVELFTGPLLDVCEVGEGVKG